MDVPFRDPMDYGMGISSLTLEPCRAAAVVGDGLGSVAGTGTSQVVTFSLQHTTTFADFQSFFTASENASGSAAVRMRCCAMRPGGHGHRHRHLPWLPVPAIPLGG